MTALSSRHSLTCRMHVNDIRPIGDLMRNRLKTPNPSHRQLTPRTYTVAPNGTLATTLGVPGNDGATIVPPPLPRDFPELR